MIGLVTFSIFYMLYNEVFFNDSNISQKLNVSLNTYKNSSVFYRVVGDSSTKNLGPKFVAISKKNQANVNVTSSNNTLISGKINLINVSFSFIIKII